MIDGTRINALAFADDLVLVASTVEGLQKLIFCTLRRFITTVFNFSIFYIQVYTGIKSS